MLENWIYIWFFFFFTKIWVLIIHLYYFDSCCQDELIIKSKQTKEKFSKEIKYSKVKEKNLDSLPPLMSWCMYGVDSDSWLLLTLISHEYSIKMTDIPLMFTCLLLSLFKCLRSRRRTCDSNNFGGSISSPNYSILNKKRSKLLNLKFDY